MIVIIPMLQGEKKLISNNTTEDKKTVKKILNSWGYKIDGNTKEHTKKSETVNIFFVVAFLDKETRTKLAQ